MFVGLTSDVDTRINNLENISLKVAYYAEITGTSGQVSIPQGATILLDQWANGVDAVLSEIQGKPTYEDTGLDVGFDLNGNYAISGPLPSSPIALIYYLSIDMKNYSNLDIHYILEQVSLVAGITVESIPIQLKAISKLSQTITPTGVTPITEVIQESNGITVDSNGHIKFNTSGFYRIQVQLNVSNTNNTSIDTCAQFYNGTDWESLPDSGNIKSTGNSEIGNFLIETTLTVDSSLEIRLITKLISGTANLEYGMTGDGAGVPSCTYIAYKINPEVSGIAIEPNNLIQNFHIGQEANLNSTFFYPNGTLVTQGEALTWDEISQSLIGRNIYVNAGRIDYNYTSLTIDYSETARYPNENTGIVLQMPHKRKSNSEIRPHIHWIQNSNNAPNILVEYRAYNNGEPASTWTLKPLTVADNVFPFTQVGQQQITEFNINPLIGDNLGLSGTFEVKIYRDSDNTSGLFAGADSYIGNWEVKYYDIHFIVDMFGSNEEFVKY